MSCAEQLRHLSSAYCFRHVQLAVRDNMYLNATSGRPAFLDWESGPGMLNLRTNHVTCCLCGSQSKAEQLSQWQQDLGKRMLLSRVSEAYGRMVLGPGLFQADCHPGNILVSDSGVVGAVLPFLMHHAERQCGSCGRHHDEPSLDCWLVDRSSAPAGCLIYPAP